MRPRALAGIAVACFAVGVTFLVERLMFLHGSVPVTGTVAATDGVHYSVRFETDGGIISLTRALPVDREERDRLKPGAVLTLRYPAGEPMEARVDGLALWFFPVGLLVVGVVGLVASRYVRKAPRAS